MPKEGLISRLLKVFNVLEEKDLAEIFGVKGSTITSWKNGDNSPQYEKILQKNELKGINIHWLLTGEGEMLLNDIGKGSQDQQAEAILRTEAEKIQLLFDRGLIRLPTVQLLNQHCKVAYNCDVVQVPLYAHSVAAGHPVDSTCNIEDYISLPREAIAHPETTFAVHVTGESMTGAGINEGDILVVDSATEPRHGSIVIASVNGEQTVKRLSMENGCMALLPENGNYQPVAITKEMDYRLLGVVIKLIRTNI